MTFIEINGVSKPIHYGHSVLKKYMAKYGLKKFIELGRLIEMLAIDDMPKFIKDGFDTAAKIAGGNSPYSIDEVEALLEENVWLESEAIEAFAKCIQRPKKPEEKEVEEVAEKN